VASGIALSICPFAQTKKVCFWRSFAEHYCGEYKKPSSRASQFREQHI
jgi:hypothetical protein